MGALVPPPPRLTKEEIEKWKAVLVKVNKTGQARRATGAEREQEDFIAGVVDTLMEKTEEGEG